MRGRGLWILMLVLAVGDVRGGNWSFAPSVNLEERYDSNVLFVGDDTLPDFVTNVGADLPVEWAGRGGSFLAFYRPLYAYFLDNEDLSNLSHFARVQGGWTGERGGWGMGAAYGLTEDPRFAAGESGQGPTLPELGTPFLVARNRTRYLLADGRIDRKLTGAWSLATAADYSTTHYSQQGLENTDRQGLLVEGQHDASARVGWTVGSRFDRFAGGGGTTSRFVALQSGAAYQVTRPLALTFLLGWIVDGSGDFAALRGADRLYGAAGIGGEHRITTWTLSYNRDFASGGGVTSVVRNEGVTGDASWKVNRRAAVGISLNHSQSQGPDLDVRSESATLRYSHAINEVWVAGVNLGASDQNSGRADGIGTFRENTVGVVFRYSATRGS